MLLAAEAAVCACAKGSNSVLAPPLRARAPASVWACPASSVSPGAAATAAAAANGGAGDTDREDADTLVFSSTFALRYAVGVGEVGGLSLDPRDGTFADPSPVLGATIHELSLHVGSALYF